MSTTTRLLGVLAAGAALLLSPLATGSAAAAGEAIPDGTQFYVPQLQHYQDALRQVAQLRAAGDKDAARDISEVPAVELINTVAVHLLSAAAVKVGLADDPQQQTDLDEARKLITALAGLVTAAATEIGDHHARPLRDGLRSVQLAFREASAIPDAPGAGPGEKYTGPVN